MNVLNALGGSKGNGGSSLPVERGAAGSALHRGAKMISLSLLSATTFTPPVPAKPSSTIQPNPSFAAPTPSKPIKKFSESDAFPRSLPLHSKNPHSVYRDIQRLARLGKLSEALSILDYLDHRGVPVNPTTFASLLSAAARFRDLPHARQIHAHIRINSLHSNEFIQQRLVQAYAACGSVDDARKVFDETPQSVFTWNALLRGNLTNGKRWSSRPLDVFVEMREAGVDVNEYTFSCLIKGFAGSPAFAQGMKAHALLIKKGMYHGFVMLQTSLIDMYFKCGRIKWAWKVFDEMPERDVVVWGAMIAGFGHNKMKREALECFRWMVSEGFEVNSVVVTSVLPVIGELSDRELGREIHGFLIKRFIDFKNMVFVHSGLVDMYCKCGDMVSGRHVFYGTVTRNVVSWTALMSGYASNGRLEQALRSVVWMQREGVKPDVVTIATALPVCTQLRALRQGEEIHGYALKNWFVPNVSIETSLIAMYSECGMLGPACRVFDCMRRKNVIAWTALIDSYIKSGRLVDALEVFRSMRQVHHHPDAVALGRVLSISRDLGALKLGKEVHAHVYKMKMESIPFLVGEIVKMYGKGGDIEYAKKVFDGVHAKGSLTCTATIEAYGHNGRYREAVDLFNWMRSNGFIPNHFTFDATLAICERAGFVKEALDVFDSMAREYKLKVTEEHCNCVIGLLVGAGRLAEAQEFIRLRSTLGQL